MLLISHVFPGKSESENDLPDEPDDEEADTPAPPNQPNYCQDARIDAIGVAFDKHGTVFAFQGDYVLALDFDGVMAGYPKHISSEWPMITSGPVDAMLVRPELWKDESYWWWTRRTLVSRRNGTCSR